jgi:hypothetical protein
MTDSYRQLSMAFMRVSECLLVTVLSDLGAPMKGLYQQVYGSHVVAELLYIQMAVKEPRAEPQLAASRSRALRRLLCRHTV